MPKDKIARLNLEKVESSLDSVRTHWDEIQDKLEKKKIGRKDTPFDSVIMERMMSGYRYLDSLLEDGVEPFLMNNLSLLIEFNHRVHYGTDQALRKEYFSSMLASAEKFYQQIDPIYDWYHRHTRRGDNPKKIASEIYVAILGHPQLFVEGNHRAGNLIADWIDMYNGYAPFVLSEKNAICFFEPASEIKRFADKTSWRSVYRLPKYRTCFKEFWEHHLCQKYILD